jgi:hypothetical protein
VFLGATTKKRRRVSNATSEKLWGRLTESLVDENICTRAIMSVSDQQSIELRRTVDVLGSGGGGEGGVWM